jgi:excinuclease UvrABC nuclease subunit
VSARPAAVALLPQEPGVYRFRAATGRVLYLGRAANLRRRVSSYWGDLGDRRHLRRMMPQVAAVEALVCASEHEAAWAERALLEHRMPRWNRSVGGQESPMYLQLDTAPAAPHIAAAFRPGSGVAEFGPYLGNRKVRLAVSALRRLYPIDDCGTRLTAAQQELARRRRRGESPELAVLAAAVTAVLDREDVAVADALALLAARRDAAVGELAFELASRIHQEIAALEWVTSTQEVVRPGTGDAAPCAWSDGTMVRLSVRDGWLREWVQEPVTQRGCGSTAPAEWTDFVRRNAELAAVLSAGHRGPTEDTTVGLPASRCPLV